MTFSFQWWFVGSSWLSSAFAFSYWLFNKHCKFFLVLPFVGLHDVYLSELLLWRSRTLVPNSNRNRVCILRKKIESLLWRRELRQGCNLKAVELRTHFYFDEFSEELKDATGAASDKRVRNRIGTSNFLDWRPREGDFSSLMFVIAGPSVPRSKWCLFIAGQSN